MSLISKSMREVCIHLQRGNRVFINIDTTHQESLRKKCKHVCILLLLHPLFPSHLALIPVISKNNVNPDTIFANNEMSLGDIEIYGFDYDYTLAFYSRHLHTLIFNIARDILIQEHRVRSLFLQSRLNSDP